MAIQKIFWADNVKFLRRRKKLSQESMAEALQVSRSKLNAHENGHTINPPVEDLFRISAFFRISIDSLLKVKLSLLGELKLRELEAGNDVYMSGGRIRVLAITVDKDDRENVEYVPVKAKAGYRSGYSDPEFIASLPRYSFPDLPRSGSFRMFPITGDSMLPIPDGSDVLARYIQDWTSIRAGTLCIVILDEDQDLVFKKVTIRENEVLLESLNKQYKPYTVTANQVLEIWQFERLISKDTPEAATDLDELKGMILDLKMQLKRP
jgi:transcriptional regulator with XRE-family HTH domain